ncbi:CPBP family intramembrane glutamic endopeptidase [Haliscomenobacter hydrossis]|uniref:Abortive infection protein n=1 Tax=Haliscomenobacter hydrossis (strain ATCC 27775 / DSM 1100 / LMG 10767 / O) TaxID=760192 RepID=F4L2Y9_HALH1|nr:CPBP family intramembrane glutamic endopeptidase [Haliscomenobacter hydrossis]AEE49669.1 Abortive infection protein [Haliscomenobacter hydrossis DSM 1100]
METNKGTRTPLKFFLLVYGFSIPLWIIETMIDVKGLPLDIPITDILATLTPLIVASMLIYKEEGHNGVKRLFQRILDFSRITKKIWYVPIIFLPFLLYLLIYLIIYFTGLPLPRTFHIPFQSIPFLFPLFFIGAICEEIGYMGYAIEPMQERFGALAASILIGIPWAVWHYPSIIQQGQDLTWIAWATLGTVAVRVLIVWIYNNTGKSLFACILFHTMLNTGRPLFPKDDLYNPLVDYPKIHYSVIAITAVVVAFLWGTKTLASYKNA